MFRKLQKKTEGFTIIEVLIVLAIAGLILLIVFLAVPALQRNARNTQRKNDIARLGGSITEFVNNNNGTVPTTQANMDTIFTSAGSLSQYVRANALPASGNIATGTQSALGGGTGPGATATNITNVRFVTNATCSTSTAGATVPGTTTRQSAIQYMVESGGGGSTPVCQDI